MAPGDCWPAAYPATGDSVQHCAGNPGQALAGAAASVYCNRQFPVLTGALGIGIAANPQLGSIRVCTPQRVEQHLAFGLFTRRVVELHTEVERRSVRSPGRVTEREQIDDSEWQPANAEHDRDAFRSTTVAQMTEAGANLASQRWLAGQRRINPFEYEDPLTGSESVDDRGSRERPMHVNSNDAHTHLVLFAQAIRGHPCRLDRGALRQQHGLGII